MANTQPVVENSKACSVLCNFVCEFCFGPILLLTTSGNLRVNLAWLGFSTSSSSSGLVLVFVNGDESS